MRVNKELLVVFQKIGKHRRKGLKSKKIKVGLIYSLMNSLPNPKWIFNYCAPVMV
jgi:hypothetical protein